MALADPQTITVDSVAQTLNRVKSDGYRSEYQTADETFKFTVSHQESKNRTRHMIRLDNTVIAADPLTAVNAYKTLGVYVVIDEPEFGFTDAVIYDVAAGLIGWLTEANIGKVTGGQS